MTKRRFYTLLVLAIALLFNPAILYASPLDELNSERLAISLVIDTSGSMTVTDPNMLRSQVAETFIGLLYPDDYLGIVTFNSKVDLVVPMTRMESDETRDNIRSQLTGRLQGRGDTDYSSALQIANKQLEELYVADVRKLIIFLTDGKPDPDPINITANPQRMNEYMDGLWNQVGEIAGNGYPIYSIGFSEGIDVGVLNRLATDTGGDVRIYRDSAELEANLIKVLQSREQIVKELLAPAIIQASNLKPVLNNEFWPRSEGYRLGQTETAVASILIGNKTAGEGTLMKVSSMKLIIEDNNGAVQTVDLFDNGNPSNDDVRAGDGRWSNRLIFNEELLGNARIEAELEYRGEPYSLKRDIGKISVSKPGSVLVAQEYRDAWVRLGMNAELPIRLESRSQFKEVVTVSLNSGEGTLISNQIELAPGSTLDAIVAIELPKEIKEGTYEYSLVFGALYPETEVINSIASYNLEVVGFFGGIVKSIEENLITIAVLAVVFVALPLFIYIFGMLLYGILVKPSSRLKGSLQIWRVDQPDNIKELGLKKLRKEAVVLSFDKSKKADEHLENDRFRYDILIQRKQLEEGKKFLLGWKRLFSKKSMAYTAASCTIPGIIEHKDGISTEIKLYDGVEFTSGGYKFQYNADKKAKRKEDEAGRDILEGRTNGI